MNAKGIVKEVLVKDWKGKSLYTIKLNGDSNYYNTGVEKPPKVGTFIEFDFTINDKGYKQVDMRSIVEKTGSDIPATTKISSATGASRGMGKDDYWERKENRDITVQKRIELQSCRNSAIAFISTLLTSGAVKLPAKQADQADVIEEMLSRYTSKFVEQNAQDPSGPVNEEVVTDNDKPAEKEWA